MDDDDDLQLSSAAQAALAEFLAEKQVQEASVPTTDSDEPMSIDSFPEDWQLSQFWYDDETADKLAKELLHDATKDTVIAIISAPSVYAKIRTMSPITQNIYLFEHDNRFSRLCPTESNFVFYDFNNFLRFPPLLKQSVDVILADPPFLSDECLTKTAVTVRALRKKEGRTMVCTGRKMEEMVPRCFPGVVRTEFEPQHKGGLANAFACYMDWKGQYV